MPYCKRCGELGRAEKCKKCGTSFALLSSTSTSRDSDNVDRWKTSKYLDQVVGAEEKDQIPVKKKWMAHRKIPSILIDKKYRVTPLHPPKLEPQPRSPSTFSYQHTKAKDLTCGHCHQQLTGKLVEVPDEIGKKYHWSCLLCHECHQPFQTTSVYLDSKRDIYHPQCAAMSSTVEKTCTRCKHHISDQYLAIHDSVLHTECFQCSDCHNVLKSASVYCHKNQESNTPSNDINESVICRPCYQSQYPQDQYTADNNSSNTGVAWLIVPQPLVIQISTTRLTYHSPTTPPLCVDQPAPHLQAVLPSPPEVQPSDLVSSKHYSSRQRRPLPQFGTVKICPGCQNRIASVHDERTGPRAAKWHRQCLVCCSCHKVLDSSAKIQQAPESERLIPTCTTCLLQKQNSIQKRNSVFIRHL